MFTGTMKILLDEKCYIQITKSPESSPNLRQTFQAIAFIAKLK